MQNSHANQVEEVLFSFSYAKSQQASRCNEMLSQLFSNSFYSELESCFEEVNSEGLEIKLDSLEIDLGTLSESDLNEELGEMIRELLLKELKKAVRGKLNLKMSSLSDELQKDSSAYLMVALKMYFLKGYFPSWLVANYDLKFMLDHGIAANRDLVASLVREVSLQSENARKRIAFLDSGYFEKIIAVLIPEDATWVLGYRDSYLEVHQKDSKLQGSAENLEQALNLFILNFITQDSGSKFNRLNFSERFLKAIAAHYNLDFRTFLTEVERVLQEHAISSTFSRDFKETVEWVSEKNIPKNSEKSAQSDLSMAQLLAWLHAPQRDVYFRERLTEYGLADLSLGSLESRFPGFWNHLTPLGFHNLISLLAKEDSPRWVGLANDFWKWGSSLTPADFQHKGEFLRAVLQVNHQERKRTFGSVTSLEDWFGMMALYAFTKWGRAKTISQDLLKIGRESGVNNTSLTLIQALRAWKESGRPMHNALVDSPLVAIQSGVKHAERQRLEFNSTYLIQTKILWNFLQFGSLGYGFNSLGNSELKCIVSEMLKAKDPLIIEWALKARTTGQPGQRQRLWSLLRDLDENQWLEYLSSQASGPWINLIRFHKRISGVIELNSFLSKRLGQQVFNSFLESYEQRNSVTNKKISSRQRKFLQSYFSILEDSGISSAEVTNLHRRIQRKYTFLLKLALDSSQLEKVDLKVLDLLQDTLLNSLSLIGRPGFLELKRRTKDGNASLDFAKWTSSGLLSPSIKRRKSLYVWNEISIFELKQLRIQSILELEKEALEIHQIDLRKLLRASYRSLSENRQSSSLRESGKRIVLFTQHNPAPLLSFLKQNRHQYLSILLLLRELMNDGQWHAFAKSVGAELSGEFDILRQVKEFGLDKLLDKLSWSQEVFASRKKPSKIDSEKVLEILSRDSFTPLRGSKMDFYLELKFLSNLPFRIFYKHSTARIWKQNLLRTATEFSFSLFQGSVTEQNRFWENFFKQLKNQNVDLSFESLDWGYLISTRELRPLTKRRLLWHLKAAGRKGHSGRCDSGSSVRLISVATFLSVEGYFPWWSPIKSKNALLFGLLNNLEYSPQSERELWISTLLELDWETLTDTIQHVQMEALLARIKAGRYTRRLESLIERLEDRLRSSGNTIELSLKNGSMQAKQQRINSKRHAANYFKDTGLYKSLSISQQETWLKKQINRSKQRELLANWFGADSRVLKQIELLYSWSGRMYFGNLYPAKWQLWLLTFAFDFYVTKGNSYSESFLTQFLKSLTTSKSAVNWNSVFRQLMGKRDFLTNLDTKIRSELEVNFPQPKQKSMEESESSGAALIHNSGLILCWPFISALFSRLNLSEGSTIPEQNQSRAVYLLQYLASGKAEFPEYELVLNKILVGMPISQHLEYVELTQAEKDMTESLLEGMKANWTKVQNSSNEAIRETFLLRDGRMDFGTETYDLTVDRKAFDVLMESIPWNFSLVKFPWMDKHLKVNWI